VLETIPPAVSNRVDRFPIFAEFQAPYPEVERRIVVSGFVIAEEPMAQGTRGFPLRPNHRSEEVKPMRVVIVGGGFAAVQFAKAFRRKLCASQCEILLFNRENPRGSVRATNAQDGGLLVELEHSSYRDRSRALSV